HVPRHAAPDGVAVADARQPLYVRIATRVLADVRGGTGWAFEARAGHEGPSAEAHRGRLRRLQAVAAAPAGDGEGDGRLLRQFGLQAQEGEEVVAPERGLPGGLRSAVPRRSGRLP